MSLSLGIVGYAQINNPYKVHIENELSIKGYQEMSSGWERYGAKKRFF